MVSRRTLGGARKWPSHVGSMHRRGLGRVRMADDKVLKQVRYNLLSDTMLQMQMVRGIEICWVVDRASEAKGAARAGGAASGVGRRRGAGRQMTRSPS